MAVAAAAATTLSALSISTVSAGFSFHPKPIHSKTNSLATRRGAVLLSFLAHTSFLSLTPASAIEFGISGPKDWLKDQKKKAYKFLLAPVDASRESLRSAYLLLSAYSSLSNYVPPHISFYADFVRLFFFSFLFFYCFSVEPEAVYSEEDLQKFQDLFRSAARDCVPQERNSFVNFQANTGVEVCTFRLIVKNAASLLGNKDPVKLKAEDLLDNLIRSFTSVTGLASKANIQLSSDRRKIADAVSETISSLDKFEQGIRDCLEI
ncbi:uncharacterized protein LOC107460089 isoform X1 [Arachis duranensis]|uniref:Uncharacterized protein LOC107460089 isoform X1 n=1 Tax=Arachis duranensis TaxID=130453 RepID=A0A6P5MM31_ARADU|nr:uncharacterized protein LOC107460089 isoform X1 [Arachis duranensis]